MAYPGALLAAFPINTRTPRGYSHAYSALHHNTQDVNHCPTREIGALGGAGKAEKPWEEEAEHFSLYSDIFFTPSLIVSCPLPHQPAAWSPPMRTARSRVPLCHFVISSSSTIAQPLFCIQFGFYLKHS